MIGSLGAGAVAEHGFDGGPALPLALITVNASPLRATINSAVNFVFMRDSGAWLGTKCHMKLNVCFRRKADIVVREPPRSNLGENLLRVHTAV